MISLHHFPHGCLSMFPMFKYARDEKKKPFSDFPRIKRIPPTTKATLGNLKTHWKMIFALVYFWALKTKPVRCKSDGAFQFRFLVPSRLRNQKKSSCCCGKIFCERNPSSTHLNLRNLKCYCANKTVNPERAESIHLARSVSQSQCGI